MGNKATTLQKHPPVELDFRRIEEDRNARSLAVEGGWRDFSPYVRGGAEAEPGRPIAEILHQPQAVGFRCGG